MQVGQWGHFHMTAACIVLLSLFLYSGKCRHGLFQETSPHFSAVQIGALKALKCHHCVQAMKRLYIFSTTFRALVLTLGIDWPVYIVTRIADAFAVTFSFPTFHTVHWVDFVCTL